MIFSFSLQGLSFLAAGKPPIDIESIFTIFVLGIAYFVLWICKYLMLEKEQRNLMNQYEQREKNHGEKNLNLMKKTQIDLL